MAEVTKGLVVLADGFDLSQYLTSIDPAQEVDMKDVTPLGSAGAREFKPGLVERSFSAEGFFAYDRTADAKSIDRSFADKFGVPGANRIITVGEQGGSAGAPALLISTKQAAYSIRETVGEVLMHNFDARVTDDGSAKGWAPNGKFLTHQTVTGLGVHDAVDLGSAQTGYLAHLHISASAVTGVTVLVLHSPDNATYSQLFAFTAATGDTAEQRSSTSAAVQRYLKVQVSAFAGTTAKVSVAVKAGYTG